MFATEINGGLDSGFRQNDEGEAIGRFPLYLQISKHEWEQTPAPKHDCHWPSLAMLDSKFSGKDNGVAYTRFRNGRFLLNSGCYLNL